MSLDQIVHDFCNLVDEIFWYKPIIWSGSGIVIQICPCSNSQHAYLKKKKFKYQVGTGIYLQYRYLSWTLDALLMGVYCLIEWVPGHLVLSWCYPWLPPTCQADRQAAPRVPAGQTQTIWRGQLFVVITWLFSKLRIICVKCPQSTLIVRFNPLHYIYKLFSWHRTPVTKRWNSRIHYSQQGTPG